MTVTDNYRTFIRQNAAEAEAALFDLRNALRGTGIERCDELARTAEKMRLMCAAIVEEFNDRPDMYDVAECNIGPQDFD